MEREHYNQLPQAPLITGATYYMPESTVRRRVSMDSAAVEVMTDLLQIGAVTISAGTLISEAETSMKLHGVRALMVIDGQRRMLGIITASDILGERPLKLTHDRGLRHADISVGDIMTPTERIDAIEMNDVVHAKVGHILANLKHSGRQHALVIDQTADGRKVIRGIFSTTQIARQLGITLSTSEVGRSFADIEAAIGP